VQQLTKVGRQAVSALSARYNVSPETIEHMLIAVNNGGGHMAQFNCPELGGSGQWMRGGMIMVGDMFNHGLKQTVDNLCIELGHLLANETVFPEISGGAPGSAHWWPPGLGTPISSGSQNNTRYALFAGRLVVEVNGYVTVYDTLDHQIGGVSQQQGGNDSLNFSSQYGTVSVSSLPVVSTEGGREPEPTNTNFATARTAYATSDNPGSQSRESVDEGCDEQSHSPTTSDANIDSKTDTNVDVNADINANANTPTTRATLSDTDSDIIALIEKLGQLHVAGVLTDEEFTLKKQELLDRL